MRWPLLFFDYEKWVPPWFWFAFVIGLIVFLAGWVFPVIHLLLRRTILRNYIIKVGNMFGRYVS